jgi:histidinol-phosphate/aromatic aminotransferase/cobyric acid decarboxylase-like protein
VLIDEAYHAYQAGFDSAVSLVAQHANVIVLRSFSKGYCCGGLRLAFALAGREAAVRVRELVAPLQVAEFSLHAGLELLKAGDIFIRLRERVAECKRHVLRLLPVEAQHIVAGDSALPWILLHDPTGKWRAAFKESGVLVKALRMHESAYLRLSIPLSVERIESFDRKMERLHAACRAR